MKREEVVGYVVNIGLDQHEQITHLTENIRKAFPHSWLQPPESWHATLLDWIAPLVDYDGADKDKLFKKYGGRYEKVLQEILRDIPPFEINFNEIRIFEQAIIIVGHDQGYFNKIRKEFFQRVKLLEGTKASPKIVHSTLARFNVKPDPKVVEEFAASNSIDFMQYVGSFRLVRESIPPMVEFEVLNEYPLPRV